MKRLAIIGAGPIGLTAGLEAVSRGYDVTIFESGDIGSAMLRWSPIRFFSPLGMNISPRARAILNGSLPADDALLTGGEMVEKVLRPLAESKALAGRIRTHHKVISIGRRGMSRTDFPGHPIRAEKPFRLLIEGPEGEMTFEADVVFDASGGYALAKYMGAGSIPARGEREAGDSIIHSLGDLHQRLPRMSGKKILLVGHGHSAANALQWLAELAARDPSTQVVWAVRTSNRRPCQEVFDDPLPQRRDVVFRANSMAESPPSNIRVKRRANVEAVTKADAQLDVLFTDGTSERFDFIASFTGFRPDLSHLSELCVEISPVTEGSGRLYRAISNITDCLSVPQLTPADLQSGEPGFYFIGSRSYGRSSSFLLKNGMAQLELILQSMEQ